MGILSRMLRLCKADVHGVMDQLEDKGLLLKQYLREMEASLKEKEARLTRINNACRQIESDKAQRLAEAQRLEQDLELALRREKDDIARMLIRKRRALENSCELLTRRQDGLQAEQNHLAETLAQQRLQYDQLKIKTATFCQQAEQQHTVEAEALAETDYGWQAPTDEEIELELLQRREALQQEGGGA